MAGTRPGGAAAGEGRRPGSRDPFDMTPLVRALAVPCPPASVAVQPRRRGVRLAFDRRLIERVAPRQAHEPGGLEGKERIDSPFGPGADEPGVRIDRERWGRRPVLQSGAEDLDGRVPGDEQTANGVERPARRGCVRRPDEPPFPPDDRLATDADETRPSSVRARSGPSLVRAGECECRRAADDVPAGEIERAGVLPSRARSTRTPRSRSSRSCRYSPRASSSMTGPICQSPTGTVSEAAVDACPGARAAQTTTIAPMPIDTPRRIPETRLNGPQVPLPTAASGRARRSGS